MSIRTGPPFRHGDHICALYDSPEEQLAVAVGFIAEGLRAGERCLFAGYSDAVLHVFRSGLRSRGVDAVAEEARGALILLTKEQAHLAGGRFDSERMLMMLNETLEAALDEGYAGLRTCGDMTWLLDHPPGASQVMEYEALVTEVFKNVRALAMCQYDRSRFPGETVAAAMAVHPVLRIGGAEPVTS